MGARSARISRSPPGLIFAGPLGRRALDLERIQAISVRAVVESDWL
jgi:hypothetical protein